jgi:hypothetical protein
MQPSRELSNVFEQALRSRLQVGARIGGELVFVSDRTLERRTPGDFTCGFGVRRGQQAGVPSAQTIRDDARELIVGAEDLASTDRQRMSSLTCGLLEALHDPSCEEERSCYL